ncbi:hypothetical protein ACJ41O_006481 [Fusarium nematophilum]
MSAPAHPLHPTFEGFIGSTMDALILFEACLSGALKHIPRRPHDRERGDLIRSGNVFIYEEHASGIKRWTDGISWSPSRVLGNFLIHRELEKPFPPGEKKRALKKSKIQRGITKPESSRLSNGVPFPSAMDTNANGKDAERALIGSLIDSYPFKPQGLVKKTISVTFQGILHHLVSYYSIDDARSGRLMTPTKHHPLGHTILRSELTMSQNFRVPVDESECNTREHQLVQLGYGGFYEWRPLMGTGYQELQLTHEGFTGMGLPTWANGQELQLTYERFPGMGLPTWANGQVLQSTDENLPEWRLPIRIDNTEEHQGVGWTGAFLDEDFQHSI